MSDLRTDAATGPTTGAGARDGTGSAGQASQVADDYNVHYLPGEHKFEITLNGKPTTISPLEAVCYVLQSRYTTMSASVAEQTREMQEQVNEINEAHRWQNAIVEAESSHAFEKPGDASPALQQWMDKNDIDVDNLGSPPDLDKLKKLETQFSNHIDQLSSTNDLKMLKLKTVVNKSQEALTGADGVEQVIKQLFQTINNRT